MSSVCTNFIYEPEPNPKHIKAAHKMLLKLNAAGFNFISVLRTAFTSVNPKRVRIQSNPQYLFTLLGSTCAKAASKMLLMLNAADLSAAITRLLFLPHIFPPSYL